MGRITRPWFWTLMLLFVVGTSAAFGATVYVKPDGSDANSGLSWAAAKKTVTEALRVVTTGDKVWVARGTYTGCITLRSGVALYGGFSGTELLLGDRAPFPRQSPDPNETILDGGGSGSVVTSPTGASSTTVIDGFTIRNGAGTPGSDSFTRGGGIYCNQGYPKIRNNTITDNTCSEGGGIYCGNNATAVISNNVIYGNKTISDDNNTIIRGGGGIACVACTPTISGNSISHNSAQAGGGGGVYLSNSAPTILSNTISGNVSGTHGGGIHCISSNPLIQNNVIRANSGISYGGGIACFDSPGEIVNNSIVDNSSENGGGIYFSDSTALIANNIIAFNIGWGCSKDAADTSEPVFICNDTFGNELEGYHGMVVPTGAYGNIADDPKLASLAYGNVHIQPTSPCMGQGDTLYVSWDKDIDGEPRIDAEAVDIGADQSNGSTWGAGPYRIVRVTPTGDDANDGSSWALAKGTVQAAINYAASVGGDVWAAAGSYYEVVRLEPYVNVYGGFTGSEDSRDLRNWNRNTTTLSPPPGASVVVDAEYGGQSGVIDGLDISPQWLIIDPEQTGTADSCGGGIRCYGASPKISHNTIRNCYAYHGGGIWCQSSNAVVSNNVLIWNGASEGTGIYCAGGSPAITNNTIADNCHSYYGTTGEGSALFFDSSKARVAYNIIAFNVGGGVGGAQSWYASLARNDVYGNLGENYAGVAEPGAGDVSVDPRFASRSWNYRIRGDSECVDGGDPGVGVGEVDFDGQPRLQGAKIDIGADESDGSPYNIHYVTPGGAGNFDGLSWENAAWSIQSAIDSAFSSDQVWVQHGFYPEYVTLQSELGLYGGFAGNETTFDQRPAFPRSTPDAYESVIDNTQYSTPDYTVSCENAGSVIIDGFTIRGGQLAVLHSNSSSPLISNNIIRDGARVGISCSGGPAHIANNKVLANKDYEPQCGISCAGDSSLIANNSVLSNSGNGIYCDGLNMRVLNNTVLNNTGAGIHCGYQSTATVANNILALNGIGISGATGATEILHNNCVFGNKLSAYSGVSQGNSDILEDPLLTSTRYGNVHTAPNSPCREAGSDSDAASLSVDVDGQPRKQGLHVDIGADESDGTTASPGPYAIIRVSPSGNDDNDGSDWGKAKKTIQAAVDSASAQGGDVWVADGIYPEQVVLWPYAYLYGGFRGKERTQSERNWLANTSIIDPNASGRCVTVWSGSLTCGIDGFTLRNGLSTSNGGGISCDLSSATIANNTIIDCSSSWGGGIYAGASSWPVVTSNTISRCSASNGGGVSARGGSFLNNHIISNTATNAGAGLYCAGSVTCSGNVIARNIAPTGAGVYLSYSGNVVTNNTIAQNSASSKGGGVYYSFGDSKLNNNIIAFNGLHGIDKGTTTGLTLMNNDFYMNLGDEPDRNSHDPMFVDLANGDYHLQYGSECIDAGWNNASGMPAKDIDGEDRLLNGVVDIGADECSLTIRSIDAAKKARNATNVFIGQAVVTAAFDGYFYIEADDRSCGIMVVKAMHGLTSGQRADVMGLVRTNASGERYIDAYSVDANGVGVVAPLFTVNKTIGGGRLEYDPISGAGQMGISGGVGLNNVGLLFCACGKFHAVNDSTFTISDGSGTYITCFMPAIGMTDPEWDYLSVTGVCSLAIQNENVIPVIRVRTLDDVVAR